MVLLVLVELGGLVDKSGNGTVQGGETAGCDWTDVRAMVCRFR